jgi:hypothetical protein
MNLEARIVAALKTCAAGSPVAVQSLAHRFGITEGEILKAAAVLVLRRPGEDCAVTIVKKTNAGEDGQTIFLSWNPLPLNDEPER